MKILVVGATSAIAEATMRRWASVGAQIFLVGRNAPRLEAIAADLALRGAGVSGVLSMDINDLGRHKALVDDAIKALGGLDVVLIAHGTLGDQLACEKDAALMVQEFSTNAVSAMSLLTYAANYLEAQRHGTIVAISSVAGDRGRQSNYVYGSAKGALTTFLQGLRQRLSKSGVNVLTVKPGFVDTPMTAAFKKGALWAKPDQIAAIIIKSVQRRRSVVYAPSFWWAIMLIIKSIPEPVFRKLKL